MGKWFKGELIERFKISYFSKKYGKQVKDIKNFKGLPDDLEYPKGVSYMYDFKKNVFLTIKIDGIEYQNDSVSKNKATQAPYNFIPLNDKIVSSEFTDKAIPPFGNFYDRYTFINKEGSQQEIELNTGHVNLEITNLTDFFVGSGHADNEGYQKFFSPINEPQIPGSSIRGLIRSLIEIVAWGRMDIIEDKQPVGQVNKKEHKYKYSTHIILSNTQKREVKDLDIPTAIFGKKQMGKEAGFAGRVFFEDACLIKSSDKNESLTKNKILQSPSTPNPAAFKFYLDQEKGKKTFDNNDAELRGYKQYWHGKNPTFTSRNDKEDIDVKIKPIVTKNNKWKGRIRFQNLSNIELGALLFVLKLNDHACNKEGEYCYKLGMGKPYKLGSIKISMKLYLNNIQKRYSSFSSALGYKPIQEKNTNKFLNCFEDEMKKQLKLEAEKSLWEDDRLMELKCMLEFSKPPKDTNYKKAGEASLPKPTQVK